MDDLDTPTSADSPEAIREDIEATRQQLQADLEALEQRLTSTFSIDMVRATIRENPVPWVIGGLGLGALALGYAIRRRGTTEMPPLPPKGTRRHAIAETARVAEKEGLITPEVRAILISLLTAGGLRWLSRYLSDRVQHASEELAERATPMVKKARGTTMTAAERAQEQVRDQAEKVVTRVNQDRNGRSFTVRNWLPGH
ncbi:MAG: DUF3618 domain-containing protein [Ardenticatenaceae bacterium]|nr:DUF3618 domain-containing protein [Ardenticatenaceae bacterium]